MVGFETSPFKTVDWFEIQPLCITGGRLEGHKRNNSKTWLLISRTLFWYPILGPLQTNYCHRHYFRANIIRVRSTDTPMA